MSVLQDVKYVEDKLKDLMNIAEDGIHAIDNQVRDLEYNISKLEEQTDEDMSTVWTPSTPLCTIEIRERWRGSLPACLCA